MGLPDGQQRDENHNRMVAVRSKKQKQVKGKVKNKYYSFMYVPARVVW